MLSTNHTQTGLVSSPSHAFNANGEHGGLEEGLNDPSTRRFMCSPRSKLRILPFKIALVFLLRPFFLNPSTKIFFPLLSSSYPSCHHTVFVISFSISINFLLFSSWMILINHDLFTPLPPIPPQISILLSPDHRMTIEAHGQRHVSAISKVSSISSMATDSNISDFLDAKIDELQTATEYINSVQKA